MHPLLRWEEGTLYLSGWGWGLLAVLVMSIAVYLIGNVN